MLNSEIKILVSKLKNLPAGVLKETYIETFQSGTVLKLIIIIENIPPPTSPKQLTIQSTTKQYHKITQHNTP